jgi:hypothetical protein
MSDIVNHPDPDSGAEFDAAFDPAFEAEFADFLQGKGELAGLLQALPQPLPSKQLDERIMAAAAAALNREAPVVPVAPVAVVAALASAGPDANRVAANDPAPGAGRRWRVPLGIAASLLLTLSVTLQMHQEHPDQVAVQGEAAPAVKEAAPAEQAVAESVAQPAANRADSGVSERVSDAAAPVPQPMASGAAQPGTPVVSHSAKKAAKRAHDAAEPMVREQEKMLARQAAPQAQSAQIAAMQVQEDKLRDEKREHTMDKKVKRAQSEESGLPQAVVSASEIAPGAERARPAARVMAAPPPPVPASVAAPAAAPAPAMARAVPAESVVVTGNRQLAGPEPAKQAQQAQAAVPSASVWLARIAQSVKQGKRRAALEEWDKFRRQYPHEPVEPALQKQIDAWLAGTPATE